MIISNVPHKLKLLNEKESSIRNLLNQAEDDFLANSMTGHMHEKIINEYKERLSRLHFDRICLLISHIKSILHEIPEDKLDKGIIDSIYNFKEIASKYGVIFEIKQTAEKIKKISDYDKVKEEMLSAFKRVYKNAP